MLVDTSESVLKLVQPRSFAGLMTLYESNYIRLRQLLGPLDELPDRLRSEVDDDPPLSLVVVERARYTTSIAMTYWFAGAGGRLIADPDLAVKLYHDAGMAEVLACRNGRRHPLLRNYTCAGQAEIVRRWSANMLLYKWLEYCIDRGHFDAQPRAFRPRRKREH